MGFCPLKKFLSDIVTPEKRRDSRQNVGHTKPSSYNYFRLFLSIFFSFYLLPPDFQAQNNACYLHAHPPHVFDVQGNPTVRHRAR